ncbi:MAG: sigma-54-dependent Fis family transcriptional regulator [Spirochaetales bacterium]|nr:sigma-54-dependent Fis family transcriptional regulator [Spirochaetales bacterium]
MNSEEKVYPQLPVLLVDDEEIILKHMRHVLNQNGVNNIVMIQRSIQVLDFLSENRVSVVVLDLMMPQVSGQDLLERITHEFPATPVIIATGNNDIKTAVSCLKAGAYDYMVKPVDINRLVINVQKAIQYNDLNYEYQEIHKKLSNPDLEQPDIFSSIITSHSSMQSIFKYCEVVAKTSRPVLITGETGVGKELLAKVIHDLSERQGNYLAVNVSGYDDTLFSDTLFGHLKGAYTGAHSTRKGIIESAAQGTLFLDEIGDLSSASQVKLLRVIQEMEYFPLGADRPRATDARLIVATNSDLEERQEQGTFRKDLYYRLRIHHIHLPPLRQRMEDLPMLISHFIHKASQELAREIPHYDDNLLHILENYDFPGNIRELEGMIFNAVSMTTGNKLSMEIFSKLMNGKTLPVNKLRQGESILFQGPLPTIKQMEELLVTEAMSRADGNQSLASKFLGISRQALNKRLKKMEDHE